MTFRTVAGLIAVYAFSLSLVASGPTPAFAEPGTEAQREACTPDAFRLCGRYIPDADRIESCLRNSGPRLSPACYAVFYPPQSAGQSANSQTTGQGTGQTMGQPRAIRPQAPVTSTLPPPPPADNDDD